MILLSSAQATDMLTQFQNGNRARTSLDLGRSESDVSMADDQVIFADGVTMSLEHLRKIEKTEDSIFSVTEEGVDKVIYYSEATRLTYKLRPTADWPALEISGILMHRIAGTTPKADAEAKLRVVWPVRGAVLDTCMGLGYTAIVAASNANSVTAIEKDENVIDMARLNPWSQPLFENPKIHMIHGDAAEIVPGIADAKFDIVNHDPPTLSVSGELYANTFYEHLLRILKPGGKLLHYTGAPGSKVRGVDLNSSVSRRLSKLGFTAVRTDPGTACVVASKRP